MKAIKILLLSTIIGIAPILAIANTTNNVSEQKSSTGVEFIFSLFQNIYKEKPYSTVALFISSEFNTEGTIELTDSGEKIPFNVQPFVTTKVELPPSISDTPANSISKKGIKVTSVRPINLYGLNQAQYSTDGFLVLPVNSLGSYYLVPGFNGGYYSANIAITASEDDTEIEVTPTAKLAPIPDPMRNTLNVPFSIKLNKLQTYLLQSEPYGDLTGTKIKSNKAISVTTGGRCAQVPASHPACDHLLEMTPPVSAWGSSFLTFPLANRLKGDLIRILSSRNNTQVKINGIIKATLAEGAYFDVIQSEPAIIETSAPASLAQFSVGQTYDNVNADPFMMIAPPTEQFSNSYTIATPEAGFTSHYINAVVKKSSITTVQLDGSPVSAELFKPIGTSNYSGAQIPITKGSHHISSNEPFGISVYGFGYFDSYGYTGGMKTEIINPTEGDYKHVKVISRLNRNNLDLDATSFTVQPSRIEQLPSHTEIEWNFPAFSIGQIKNLDYEVIARNLTPGEKRTITTSTELTYTDLNGKQHHRSLGEQNLEVLSTGFSLQAATDKPSYGPGQIMLINLAAANAGTSAASASLRLSIIDALGHEAALINTPSVINVPAQGAVNLPPINYPIGNLYQGDYIVQALLTDSNGVQTEIKIPFSLTAKEGPQASARISTDKTLYSKKDSVTLLDRLTNLSTNSQLNETTLNTRVIADTGEVYWSNNAIIEQISPQAFADRTFIIPLTNANPGRYQVVLQAVNTDGGIIATHQTEFTVADQPLLNLSTTATVTTPVIEQGQTQTCWYQFSNLGVQTITQSYDLSLVRVDTQEVISSTTADVALPAQQSLNKNTVSDNGLNPGEYACIARALFEGAPQVLANATFTVKASPIKLTGNLQLGEKPRLLVLIDPATTAEQLAEENYLHQKLSQAGWFYTLVDSAEEFATELNQGGYGEYALLSESINLDAATLNQLKSQIAAGDGLLLAGKHYAALDEVLGITARSNPAYSSGIKLYASVLGDTWEHALDSSSALINFAATTSTVLGEYTHTSATDNTGSPLGPFRVASRFNMFTFEDFISATSSVEGRLAAGGNFNIIYYGIGNKLPAAPLTDVVLIGGNVTFPNGKIYNGNLLAGGSVAGVSSGVRNSLAPGARLVGNTSLPFSFSDERAYLEELSRSIAQATANGKTRFQYGGYTLTGDCSSPVQVFSLNASELATATSLAVNCIPKNATLVLNVNGSTAKLQSIGLQALAPIRQKVLFNFAQATRLELKWVGIEGSLLAPFADVVNPQGNINGQAITKTWHAQGSGTLALFNYPFTGDLSSFMPVTNRNAVALNQYQQGISLFAGFDLLGQASRLNSVPTTQANPFGDFLLGALEALKPQPSAYRPGKAIPLLLNYSNIGERLANGQALVTLSSNLALLNPTGFNAQAVNSWARPLELAPGETSRHALYIQPLPNDTQGVSTIDLKLQAGTQTNVITRFEQNFSLSALLNP